MFNCSQLQIMQNVLRMFVSVRILLEIHRNFTSCAIHFATTRMEDILDSLLFCVLFIVAVAGKLKKKSSYIFIEISIYSPHCSSVSPWDIPPLPSSAVGL